MADDGYVKDAFLFKPNLIGLAAGVAASVILPFGGFIFLGVAAAEGLFFSVVTHSTGSHREKYW